MLFKCANFHTIMNSHFSENQLTGPMSESLFNANMSLIHV
jgi:hypothetical protein